MAKKIKYVIKWILKFNDFKNCLLNNETIIKLLERFKSKANNAFTEKIALSRNYDKRLQTFDEIISDSYGASAGKVWKTDTIKWLILMMPKIKTK